MRWQTKFSTPQIWDISRWAGQIARGITMQLSAQDTYNTWRHSRRPLLAATIAIVRLQQQQVFSTPTLSYAGTKGRYPTLITPLLLVNRMSRYFCFLKNFTVRLDNPCCFGWRKQPLTLLSH